jgi:hypothetical protein
MGWLVYVDSIIDLKLGGKNSFTLALNNVTLPTPNILFASDPDPVDPYRKIS